MLSKQTIRRVILFLVSFGFSATALYFVFRDVSWAQIWQERHRVRLDIYVWTYAVSSVAFLSLAWRIRILASSQTKLSLLTALQAVLAGYLGNVALPARVGEVIKSAYLARHTKLPFSSVLAWIAVERLVDLCCVLLCALWIIPWVMGRSALGHSVVVFVAFAAVGFVFVIVATLRPKWLEWFIERLLRVLDQRMATWLRPKVQHFIQGLAALAAPRRALGMLVCTLVYWLCTLSVMQLWMVAFQLKTPWYGSVLLLAFLSLGTALPAAAAYIGTYHFAVVAALSVLGVARETSTALAVFVHVAGMVPWVIVSLLVLLPVILRGELVNQRT